MLVEVIQEVLVEAGCGGSVGVAAVAEELHRRDQQRMNWTHSLMPTMPRFVLVHCRTNNTGIGDIA